MMTIIALLLGLLLAVSAAAQVQPLTAWWIDTGDTDSTYMTWCITPLGDINGDSLSDFINRVGHHELNVHLGNTQRDTVPDIIFHSPNSTYVWFGYGLFSVGDVNGDGDPDFIAGSFVDENSLQRYAYLYLGGAAFDTIPDVKFAGNSSNLTTFALRGVGLGDINGDGFRDFAILDEGCFLSYTPPYIRGAIYIYYGGTLPDSIPNVIIFADSVLNRIGGYIEPLGDVNGDGYDDWVMSHEQCQGLNGEAHPGVVAIYYGGNPPDTIPHTVIYGSVPGADLGLGLTTFDWDDDGQKDIFAWCANFYPPNNHGAVWEFNVSPNMSSQPDHIFFGIPGYPGIGQVLFHTDINGDGRQDLISGCPGYALRGIVYVFLNGTGQDTLYDATYYQGNFDGSLGHAGCNVGDFNGDDIEDLAIMEAYGNGRLHLILGDDSLHQSVGVIPFPQPPLPQTIVLLDAHPNPFNPSTIISFELRAASHVKLTIYDTAGRKVATLVNERRLPGEYSVTFDGARLPSGVYLAKLEATEGPFGVGEFTDAKKLVLLK